MASSSQASKNASLTRKRVNGLMNSRRLFGHTTRLKQEPPNSLHSDFSAEAMSPEELKNQSLRANSAPDGNEPLDDSDLIELDILQAVSNLSKYQKETSKWRDKKVVKKNISVGDLVLKQKPNAENIGKMEPK